MFCALVVVAAVVAAVGQASSGFGQLRLPIELKIPKASCLFTDSLFETIVCFETVAIYSGIAITPYHPEQGTEFC